MDLRREVNEYIFETLQRLGEGDDATRMHAICECNDRCSCVVEIAVATYREVRANATWKILANGHDPDGERSVIRRGVEFEVVAG